MKPWTKREMYKNRDKMTIESCLFLQFALPAKIIDFSPADTTSN